MPVHALRRTLLLAASLVAVFTLAPSSASALTLTHQSATSCNSYSAKTLDGELPIGLPQFNPQTGKLVAAVVTQKLALRGEYTFVLDDTANKVIYVDYTGTANSSLRTPGAPDMLATLRLDSKNVPFPSQGTFKGLAGEEARSAVFNVIDLASWTGTGSVFSLAATSGTFKPDFTNSGNAFGGIATVANAELCVTYTYTTELLVCIGDYVWYDDNTNGLQQTAEGGVAGRPVTVTDAAGNVLATTTTSQDGRWVACGLEPSTACVISVDLPDGWTVTTLGDGSDPARDSNGFATPSGDATIPCVTPPAGEDLTFDVGIHRPPTPAEASSPAPASLRLTKSSNTDTISSRGVVSFTVRVTNRGQRAVRNLRVCDSPPAQLAFTTRPRGATMRNGQMCWNVRALAGKRTITYRYTMRAANVAARQCVMNRATAVAGTGGTASARDAVCIRATRLGVLKLAG